MARKYMVYATKEKIEQINPKNVEHIRRYFVSKNLHLSDSSKKSYESDFNQWLVFIMERYDNLDVVKGFDVEDAADMIEDYVAFCTSVLGNNERRIQRRLSSISSFYLFLKKKRKIESSPMDLIDRPKVGKGEKLQIKQTFLTQDQVNEIRKKLDKLGDIQLICFFEVALSTMARVNALSNITLKQIDFKQKRIEDVLEKEGKEVTLYPSDRAVKAINAWLKYRKDNGIENDYLFLAKNKGAYNKVGKSTIQGSWVKKIGNLIGIPELHAHDLRHSGSNLLFHSGLSLESVSYLLSHSGTDVTRDHYLQINREAVQSEKAKFEI